MPTALGSILAGFLGAIAIGGCGSSAAPPPSRGDPASAAPHSALAYIELAVRPRGSTQQLAEQDLTKLLGQAPDPLLQRAANRLLGRADYASDVRPWLGQRIGIVLTAPSAAGVAVIAPTANRKAAAVFLDRFVHHGAARVVYHGVTLREVVGRGGVRLAGGIVGGVAVVGGEAAVHAIADTRATSSLAADPRFTQAMSAVPAESLLRAYMRLRPLLTAYLRMPSFQRQFAQVPGALTQVRSQLATLGNTSAVTLALTFGPSSIALDWRTTGVIRPRGRAGGSPPEIGGLPAGSWLALSTGGSAASGFSSKAFAAGFNAGLTQSLRQRGLDPAAVEGVLQQRFGLNVARDLLPSLGPLRLAVSGRRLSTLAVGLAVQPADPAAAVRLVAAFKRLASSSLSFADLGPHAFGLVLPRLNGHAIVVNDLGRELVALLAAGRPSISSFLSPPARLASDPAYARALSQLPGGSHAALYVSFAPLAALVASSPRSGSVSTQRALRILRSLRYLIAGGANGVTRIVLGLN